jgi:monofunctional glycosyltransferase
MAKRKTGTIPTYKRKRQRGVPARILGWLVRLVLGFILLSVLWVLAYRFVPPPITATMIGDFIAGRGVNKDWMSINQIDRDMVRAAIAAEDSKFCSHDGFDFDAIEQAMQRNASGGRIRGGSTISQQTAKNAFLWQGGGYVRKGVEAWFTVLIEAMWPKRRIMEIYLNLAETGIGTYGVNAGSQRYYGHDASAMSRTEAARIAAILPLPKKRGAIAPKGFTRRYGGSIAARIGVVARDGLDACVYSGAVAPKDKAPL